MRRIALYRLDQIGNEIGAAFALRFNAAPALGNHVPPAHQAIEHADSPEDDDNGNAEDDESDHGAEIRASPYWRLPRTSDLSHGAKSHRGVDFVLRDHSRLRPEALDDGAHIGTDQGAGQQHLQ